MSKFSKFVMMVVIIMIGVIAIGWMQNETKADSERESSERMCRMYRLECDY